MERLELFRDDLKKLRDWNHAHILSKVDLRDASVVIFRWLFDHSPILQAVCDEAGIMLQLPGASDTAKAYSMKVVQMQPQFYLCTESSGDSPFGMAWVSLAEYTTETLLYIGGHAVTNRTFIGLVRNKLGGGHFDVKDRTKWQRDLLDISEQMYLSGQNAINYAMKCMINGLMRAIDEKIGEL
jgi:hypothetical protein